MSVLKKKKKHSKTHKNTVLLHTRVEVVLLVCGERTQLCFSKYSPRWTVFNSRVFLFVLGSCFVFNNR